MHRHHCGDVDLEFRSLRRIRASNRGQAVSARRERYPLQAPASSGNASGPRADRPLGASPAIVVAGRGPRQIGGSAGGYQDFFAPLAIPAMAGQSTRRSCMFMHRQRWARTACLAASRVFTARGLLASRLAVRWQPRVVAAKQPAVRLPRFDGQDDHSPVCRTRVSGEASARQSERISYAEAISA